MNPARICGLLCICLVAVAGCSRKEKSTEDLLRDLGSSDEKAKLIAVRLLPQRQNDAARVVPSLMIALKDPDANVRCSAAIGLGYFNEKAREAIPALLVAKNDVDVRVREAAAKAISRIDSFTEPAGSPSAQTK